jgi:YesN/AraC family two-component response regulator
VLVDDERLIRTALGRLLIGAGLELVGGAATAQEAIELVLDLRPTSC